MTEPTTPGLVAPSTRGHVVDVGVVSLLPDDAPGVEAVLDGLADRLRESCPSIGWRVVALDGQTDGDGGPAATSLPSLLGLGRRRLLDSGVDVVLVLTGTPATLRRRRLRAHVSPVQQTAVLQVADGAAVANGGLGPRAAVDDAALLVLSTVGLDDPGADPDVLRQLAAEPPAHEPAPGPVLSGSLGLLLTLVRQNRPWLMTVHLSKTLTGALAASVLAVVTPDFWLLADRMTATRLALITTGVLVLLCGVLVIGGGLRERAGTHGARRAVLLHNAAVWISVAIGVASLYVGLTLVDLVVSLLVLPHRLLTETLGHPASWPSVLRVGALTSTVALVGSVFGAGLEDDEDVQVATYTGSDDARYANG